MPHPPAIVARFGCRPVVRPPRDPHAATMPRATPPLPMPRASPPRRRFRYPARHHDTAAPDAPPITATPLLPMPCASPRRRCSRCPALQRGEPHRPPSAEFIPPVRVSPRSAAPLGASPAVASTACLPRRHPAVLLPRCRQLRAGSVRPRRLHVMSISPAPAAAVGPAAAGALMALDGSISSASETYCWGNLVRCWLSRSWSAIHEFRQKPTAFPSGTATCLRPDGLGCP